MVKVHVTLCIADMIAFISHRILELNSFCVFSRYFQTYNKHQASSNAPKGTIKGVSLTVA